MSLVRPVPGFIPPVVGLPAANAIVPFVPPVVGGAAAVGGLIGGAPPLVVVGGAIVAGVLLGAAVEQLWGWANGRKERSASRYPDLDGLADDKKSAVADPAGVTRYEVRTPETYSQYRYIDSVTGPVFYLLPGAWPGHSNPGITYTRQLRLRWTDPAGIDYDVIPTFFWQWNESTNVADIAHVREAGTGLRPPAVPWPVPVPAPPLPEPEPLAEPEPLPRRPLAPPPVTVPTIPGSIPTTEPAPAGVPTPTTPRTSPPPATLPRIPGFPAPVPTRTPSPTGTQTRPDGTLSPTPKTPVVKTPTDVHVIDGIPIPGNGPRPTPEGTAQELGRIERKLAQLIDPKKDAPGQSRDRLGWLHDNIGNIIDFFLSINDGGEYRISSPCELDENGDRIERVVTYDGNLQSLGVISNKIDALAELLQEHKDLKQPICRETPATGGQAVTVNFVQID